MTQEESHWSEDNSRLFIDYARYFVPQREAQIHTLISLVPGRQEPFHLLELACGAGDLARALLEHFPTCTVTGLDGSQEMLQTASQRLLNFGERFKPATFDLFDRNWRTAQPTYQAVLSSLAIHHLDDAGKAELFRDVFAMLLPGGAFVIADIMRPASPLSAQYAASEYDDIVRRQSQEFDGSLRAFEYFEREHWNLFRYPDDPIDRPSTLFDQLKWLEEAGFIHVDVFWLQAGHAVFGGTKPE